VGIDDLLNGRDEFASLRGKTTMRHRKPGGIHSHFAEQRRLAPAFSPLAMGRWRAPPGSVWIEERQAYFSSLNVAADEFAFRPSRLLFITGTVAIMRIGSKIVNPLKTLSITAFMDFG
jgi:hypothetical protein